MPLSTNAKNELTGHLIGKTSAPFGTKWYGFSSTLPTDAGTNITEPSGGGYARKQATAANMTAPANGSSSNVGEIVFDAATADWLGGANLPYITVWKTVSGTTTSDFVGWIVAPTPRPVLNGNIARIPASAIVISQS